jgi:hypothetical protein
MGELPMRDATPGGLRFIFVDDVPSGKKQIMTMPKAPNITAADKLLIRSSIAESYALGSQVLVPWDIYLPTPRAQRYYGSAHEYGDLFLFVTKYAEILETTSSFLHYSTSTSNMILTHTGEGGDGGDGKRFRLPTDIPPSQGLLLSANVGTCSWECSLRSNCTGMFVDGRSKCWLLFGLVEVISGTSMSGQSFLSRKTEIDLDPGSFHLPFVLSSDPMLDVVMRANCDNTTIVAHLINWKHTENNSFDIRLSGVGCGTNRTTRLAVPQIGGPPKETDLHPVNCTENESWYEVENLTVWGLLIFL